MKRQIVKIDEDKCNGCGLCIPNCHEGALQIIDGKARLVSDLMCDGLGACIGHCPEEAITLEEREAEAYDEVLTIKEMVKNGRNTVLAHLKHLKDHNEKEFLRQGIDYLWEHEKEIPFAVNELIEELQFKQKSIIMKNNDLQHVHTASGCPGSRAMQFHPKNHLHEENNPSTEVISQLAQWPVQMHLVNPMAGYFQKSDLLLAADCVAFALGNFHNGFLKGKSLGIACPKLDSNKEVYVKKLVSLIDDAKVNTITVMIMEVPCCSGLLQLVEMARSNAQRKVPVKAITVGIQGDVLSEEWV